MALEHTGLVVAAHRLNCITSCGILVPQPEIKPVSPALEGGFLTTGPPGKPQEGASWHEPHKVADRWLLRVQSSRGLTGLHIKAVSSVTSLTPQCLSKWPFSPQQSILDFSFGASGLLKGKKWKLLVYRPIQRWWNIWGGKELMVVIFEEKLPQVLSTKMESHHFSF